MLLGGAVAYATTSGEDPPSRSRGGPARRAAAAPATVPDTATATGLTVNRQAVYDAETESVELTITYAAQNAAARRAVPRGRPRHRRPAARPITWEGASVEQNLRSRPA